MRGDVGGGHLLRLLPTVRNRPSGVASHASEKMAGGRGRGGSGLRRAHGAVLHGLSAGPTGVLLLPLGLQGRLPGHVLSGIPAQEAAQGRDHDDNDDDDICREKSFIAND